MAEVKPDVETVAKIKVVGVGGSGNSAVDRMIASKIKGIEFWAVNTDVQALHASKASHKVHIGKNSTRGLGAGMDPSVGRRAAEESINELREALKGSDMVFVTCGLGGGTGTGAAPVVAQVAKEIGALTVAVVTKPFGFEGPQRKMLAEKGHEELSTRVDAIITINNDQLLQSTDKKTTLLEAFDTCDDVLRQGVQGLSEIITVPGLINVDFADVRAIMADTGSALMGIGVASGDNRAVEAAKMAVLSPLLDISIEGARGILFTLTGGSSLGMQEVSEAAKVITQNADPSAKIIFGAVIDPSMKDDLRITVIATGFDEKLRHLAASSYKETNKPLSAPLVADNQMPVSKPMPASVAPATPVKPKETSSFFGRTIKKSKFTTNETPLDIDPELDVPAFIRKKWGN